MVPANKILTVAYGTFSCTLEGFDDPFSTMTGIAEYFRDLAADDRFFGAEPPTPDMAMLRTIAETRAKHAVTAQTEDGGVTLRPTAMPAAAAMTAAFDAGIARDTSPAELAAGMAVSLTEAATQSDAEEIAVEESAAADERDLVAADADADKNASDESLPDAHVDIIEQDVTSFDAETSDTADKGEDVSKGADETDAQKDDSVAEKLARIRDVVEADRQASSVYAEDEYAEDMMSDGDETMADDTMAAAFAADALDEDIIPEAEALIADVAPVEVESEDSLAADLAAILPQHTDEADDAETPVADDADDEMADHEGIVEAEPVKARDQTQRHLRRIRVRKVRRVQAAAEAAAAAASDEADTTLSDGAEPVEIQVADDHVDVVTPEETSYDDETSDDIVEETTDKAFEVEDDATLEDDELLAELAAIKADVAEDVSEIEAEMIGDDHIEEAKIDDVAAEISDEEETTAEDQTQSDDDLMAELAAIRADDTTVEAGEDIAASFMNGALSSDEMIFEDELAADRDDIKMIEAESLAEDAEDVVEATVNDDADDVAGPEDAQDADVQTIDGKGSVPSAPDMERLFAATDSRLSGEDTSRRHANISHLKAAVAARRADGPVKAKEDTETDAYRADLASTVRPRRSTPSVEAPARTPRPERAAPLVLVSEQRVEAAQDEASAPVQPRRAPRTAELDKRDEALAGAEDFEAFAADVGASDLSDILEAAAVYSAKIMGQDNFSRPRLLHLAAEAVEDMSREDGLRGFGQLLRDGTIRKVSRGTFALAADSRYAEEADRRAS